MKIKTYTKIIKILNKITSFFEMRRARKYIELMNFIRKNAEKEYKMHCEEPHKVKEE